MPLRPLATPEPCAGRGGGQLPLGRQRGPRQALRRVPGRRGVRAPGRRVRARARQHGRQRGVPGRHHQRRRLVPALGRHAGAPGARPGTIPKGRCWPSAGCGNDTRRSAGAFHGKHAGLLCRHPSFCTRAPLVTWRLGMSTASITAGPDHQARPACVLGCGSRPLRVCLARPHEGACEPEGTVRAACRTRVDCALQVCARCDACS